MTVSVLIADDHEILRQGLKIFLSFDPELQVVGEAKDGVQALKMARELRPDIVLMDILMPRMDGVEATMVIKRELPDTEVIILTSVIDDSIIQQCLRSGAVGYLLKDTRSDELCNAIRAAASGQVQLSKPAAMLLSRNNSAENAEPSPLTELTQRELDVLRLVAEGLANKEIALRLKIAEKTVKVHVGNLLSKLRVNSRTQATLYAIRTGLVDLGGEDKEKQGEEL
jgi:NarL family two-component system response regulator LiaR